ncbi:unnamed protein product [Chrysoparadoxa australica]
MEDEAAIGLLTMSQGKEGTNGDNSSFHAAAVEKARPTALGISLYHLGSPSSQPSPVTSPSWVSPGPASPAPSPVWVGHSSQTTDCGCGRGMICSRHQHRAPPHPYPVPACSYNSPTNSSPGGYAVGVEGAPDFRPYAPAWLQQSPTGFHHGAAPDFSRSNWGRSDMSISNWERSDLSRNDYGRSDWGRHDFSRNDYGRIDFSRSGSREVQGPFTERRGCQSTSHAHAIFSAPEERSREPAVVARKSDMAHAGAKDRSSRPEPVMARTSDVGGGRSPTRTTIKNRRRCEAAGCSKIPCCNFLGQKQGRFCSTHKLEGMQDVVNRRCNAEGCVRWPNYGYPSDMRALFCSDHKQEGMINTKARKDSKAIRQAKSKTANSAAAAVTGHKRPVPQDQASPVLVSPRRRYSAPTH